MPIDASKERHLERLLRAGGRNITQLAEASGVSRQVIRDIINGVRPLFYPRGRGARGGQPQTYIRAQTSNPVVRCVECGAPFYLAAGGSQPCLACKTRAQLALGIDMRRHDPRDPGPMRVELPRPAMRRYARVKADRDTLPVFLPSLIVRHWRLLCTRCGRPYYAVELADDPLIRFCWSIYSSGCSIQAHSYCRNSDCGWEFPALGVDEFTSQLGREERRA